MIRISALTLALMLGIGYAHAQAPAAPTGSPSATPAGPPGPRQGNHPCKSDVQKLCADVQPGQGRIIACLKQHAAELSPACKTDMQNHRPAQGQRPGQQRPEQKS